MRRDALNCLSQRFRIEERTDLIKLFDFIDSERTNEVSDARNRFERAFVRQTRQGFAKRSAADPQLLREVHFVDALAGRELAVNDHVSHCRGDGVARVLVNQGLHTVYSMQLARPAQVHPFAQLSRLLSDALDLYGDTARKRARLDRRACGKRRSKERRVNLVHPREIIDVSKVHIALENVIER